MFALLAALAVQSAALPAKTWPAHEGDVVLKDFHFADGESLPGTEDSLHHVGRAAPKREGRDR